MWNKDKKMFELLNIHYNLEQAAANMYTGIATRAQKEGYDNLSKFFAKLSHDKVSAHLTRIYDYFNSVDQIITINQYSIPKHTTDTDVKEMVKEALNNELQIRKHVTYLVEYALSIKDFESYEFLQWFVKDAIKDTKDVDDINTFFELGTSPLQIERAISNKLNKDEE